MRYHVLATDYDGTLARHGQVDDATLARLEQVRKSGRRLVLVTGRELDDLKKVFPPFELFDCIVAENGALESGVSAKPLTPGTRGAALPVIVMRCASWASEKLDARTPRATKQYRFMLASHARGLPRSGSKGLISAGPS